MIWEKAYKIAAPVFARLDPETAHNLTLKALAHGCHPAQADVDPAVLHTRLWDLDFSNPVGLAAGFDKNAAVIPPMLGYGFGFVEAGTVTPRPQEGNPRPRIFRDRTSRSVINRMGFPGGGADLFEKNIHAFRDHDLFSVVGVNIGKNKDTEDAASDYVALIDRFAGQASYFAVNISSPNTPGLRDLQARENLLPLLQTLVMTLDDRTRGTRRPPLLVKLAPDLTLEQIESIAVTVLEAGIDGLILTNTTLARPDTLPADFRKQTGGLSGPHVKARALAVTRAFYKLTRGKLPIIGVGGIASGKDAYDRIRAGASLVQLYTGLVYDGPLLISRIKHDLAALLEKDGFVNVKEAVGKHG